MAASNDVSCAPRRRWLMERTARSATTVGGAAALREEGYLRVERRGSYRPHVYHFVIPAVSQGTTLTTNERPNAACPGNRKTKEQRPFAGR
jgi:hypothetical protein